MKAYFNNLATRTWFLLVIPAVALAYPLVWIGVPAVIHAVVPEVVRSRVERSVDGLAFIDKE